MLRWCKIPLKNTLRSGFPRHRKHSASISIYYSALTKCGTETVRRQLPEWNERPYRQNGSDGRLAANGTNKITKSLLTAPARKRIMDCCGCRNEGTHQWKQPPEASSNWHSAAVASTNAQWGILAAHVLSWTRFHERSVWKCAPNNGKIFLREASHFSVKTVKFSCINWQIFFEKSSNFPEKVENFTCDFTIF